MSRSRSEFIGGNEKAPALGAPGLAVYTNWWAHQDSNLEQAGYEPAALTVELWARSILRRSSGSALGPSRGCASPFLDVIALPVRSFRSEDRASSSPPTSFFLQETHGA